MAREPRDAQTQLAAMLLPLLVLDQVRDPQAEGDAQCRPQVAGATRQEAERVAESVLVAGLLERRADRNVGLREHTQGPEGVCAGAPGPQTEVVLLVDPRGDAARAPVPREDAAAVGPIAAGARRQDQRRLRRPHEHRRLVERLGVLRRHPPGLLGAAGGARERKVLSGEVALQGPEGGDDDLLRLPALLLGDRGRPPEGLEVPAGLTRDGDQALPRGVQLAARAREALAIVQG
mmetsp:Transcript_11858/g.32503  ORF Transcript_11858/g.32503 Transcript_11858/m.32503 type:complete len:234 (-) Transcript_11858:416-1117(-)